VSYDRRTVMALEVLLANHISLRFIPRRRRRCFLPRDAHFTALAFSRFELDGSRIGLQFRYADRRKRRVPPESRNAQLPPAEGSTLNFSLSLSVEINALGQTSSLRGSYLVSTFRRGELLPASMMSE